MGTRDMEIIATATPKPQLMQQFLSAVQGTSCLSDDLTGGGRNAAQDIQAQVSTWQGNRINVLTIVTMIFLPISFLTGYFGMHFTWLDDQLDSFWWWILLGVLLPVLLVVVCVGLLASGGCAVPRLLRRRHRHEPTSAAGPAMDGQAPARQ